MKLCRRLQSLAKLFRFVEVCILLVFLSWLSTRLPFVVRISGEYFRKLISLILSPISIFFLGNAIVVTLLAKSGLFSGESSSIIDNALTELCDEFRYEDSDESPVLLKEEVVFQDKEIICEENTKSAIPKVVVIDEVNEDENEVFVKEMEVKPMYRRSQSEKLKRESEKMEESKEKLRRSETEICWRSFGCAEESEDFSDDGMSNDEFRRTIEAFIAKQVSFHREERLSVVLHGKA